MINLYVGGRVGRGMRGDDRVGVSFFFPFLFSILIYKPKEDSNIHSNFSSSYQTSSEKEGGVKREKMKRRKKGE